MVVVFDTQFKTNALKTEEIDKGTASELYNSIRQQVNNRNKTRMPHTFLKETKDKSCCVVYNL